MLWIYMGRDMEFLQSGDVIKPDPKGVHGFNEFMQNYVKCLPVEKAATECFK